MHRTRTTPHPARSTLRPRLAAAVLALLGSTALVACGDDSEPGAAVPEGADHNAADVAHGRHGRGARPDAGGRAADGRHRGGPDPRDRADEPLARGVGPARARHLGRHGDDGRRRDGHGRHGAHGRHARRHERGSARRAGRSRGHGLRADVAADDDRAPRGRDRDVGDRAGRGRAPGDPRPRRVDHREPARRDRPDGVDARARWWPALRRRSPPGRRCRCPTRTW